MLVEIISNIRCGFLTHSWHHGVCAQYSVQWQCATATQQHQKDAITAVLKSMLLSRHCFLLVESQVGHNLRRWWRHMILPLAVIFLPQNSRDLTTRNRVDTESRDPVQPGCPLTKSSFHPFLRMQPPLPSPRHWALQPSPPMAHMPPMALSTWSTLCWLSCKSLSSMRN